MQIAWWVELVVKPGQLAEFAQLTREMVDFARTEAGVLGYERFVGADERVIYAFERYADSASASAHLHNFAARFAERFSQLVDRKHFLVMGTPSTELAELLDQYGATYLKPFGHPAQPPADPEVRRPLTAEAVELLKRADDGGVPMFASSNLRRIASENGVAVSDDMTPNAILDELRAQLQS